MRTSALPLLELIILTKDGLFLTAGSIVCCTYSSGFPGYGYLPAPTPGTAERHISAAAAAAAAAYYADYAAAAPTSHVPSAHAVSGVTRSEPSPMPLSNSPMHRDQYTQRTAAAGTTFYFFLMVKKPSTTKLSSGQKRTLKNEEGKKSGQNFPRWKNVSKIK